MPTVTWTGEGNNIPPLPRPWHRRWWDWLRGVKPPIVVADPTKVEGLERYKTSVKVEHDKIDADVAAIMKKWWGDDCYDRGVWQPPP